MLSFIYSLKKSSNSLGLCYRIEYAECVAYFLRLVLYYSVFQKRCALLNFGLVFFFFSHSLQVLNKDVRRFVSDEHMGWCNGGWRRDYGVQNQHKYCVFLTFFELLGKIGNPIYNLILHQNAVLALF